MIRKTIFAVATVVAIGAAALIPTEASAGGGGKGGGMGGGMGGHHGHWGHGYGGGFGAIVVGKTTMPEFGWKAVTDSPLTGVTRNPWDTRMTPGGSSGGAAAAVVLGM